MSVLGMEGNRVSRGRGLAPLVGAGMATVAAGSLVMFSLLAQHTALSPAPGDALLPRGPEGTDRPPVVVPAPEASQQGNTETPTIPFVTTSFVQPTPPVSAPTSPTEDGAPGDAPPQEDTLLASLDLEINVSEAVDLRGPLFDLRPRGHSPSDDHPEEEAKGNRECPGRPTKPRAPGEHPHGGPPACGNPHGEPPGQDKSAQARAGHDAGGPDSIPPESPGSSGAHGVPSGGSSDSTGGSPGNGGGSAGSSGGGASSSGGSGGSSSGAGGSSHPHGAPPGQAKKESSPPSSSGNSGSHPKHPHGAPPGQAKK